MEVLVPDLDEDRPGVGKQISRDCKPVTKVRQVRVDPEFPGVAVSPHLLGLAGEVGVFAVLHVPFARAYLPITSELDAIRRVDVDRLDLALEAFLIGQARHHEQRVAEDHSVHPFAGVAVELDLLLEREVRVGREEAELLLRPAALALRPELLDEGERIDRLLDVDRDRGDLEVVAVLLVLALPDELRVERGIAGVAHDRGLLLLRAGERLQLGGGDVRAGVAWVSRLTDDGRLLWADLLSHRLSADWLHPAGPTVDPSKAE